MIKLGYTIGGRYLFVVYVVKDRGIARVVTAMDMDDKTRKLYRKRYLLSKSVEDEIAHKVSR